ncbi:hypothetical protein H2O64_12740 [Kordia sp. YSTF-M3]|uniref:Uncharacterized protein n=1 Tax=Kordia aestuariivivens TaxID=2759037 RepID=A0ABR7QAD2_9FLAO|nr:hypothetical protein [Kordia aestuariivivens]MBC8755537.1 hypothetical protein [Kordia aestuariivivens]
MKKSILPILLIVASVILIVVNFIASDEMDRAFWMRTVSSVLLIFAMILTIRSQQKK